MFGKDKESKEFFEVFKKPQALDEIKYNSKVLQKEQANPTVIPKPEPKKDRKVTDAGINTEQLGWIRDTQAEERPQPDSEKMVQVKSHSSKIRNLFLNEVVIKQEVLIFGALGAVFLSLACFFVGYKVGYKNVLNPEMQQESVKYSGPDVVVKSLPAGKEIKTVDLALKQDPVAAVKQEQDRKWTLQIISYSDTKENLKRATNLAKAIKNMTGHNTFVAKRGKELVVCAGKFNARDNNEIKKALREISNLEYEGKKQFASSYPIQIK